MKLFILIFILNFSLNLYPQEYFNIDEVRIYKSQHRMDMLIQGKVVRSYRTMQGIGGRGPKRKKGDKLVPEGKYILDYKNPESQFHKSIHISYPNYDDLRRANEAGVDPGGDIMIHGYPNHLNPIYKFFKKLGVIRFIDWTSGCVAVSDKEMDEIFENIAVPVPVTIYH